MANERGGKDWLLRVETTPGGGSYALVGGLRTTELASENEAIETTNQGSNQDRELLDAAGIKQMKLTGSGVHQADAATINMIETNHRAGTLTRFRAIDTNTTAVPRQYTSLYKIVSFSRTGGYNDAQEYSISLESSGAVTIEAAVP